jgi:hypothetical protein
VATRSSGSCVTVFDADGDGDLDVFRGGQVVAHKYPMSPRSYLLENRSGTFVDVTATVAPELQHTGMVTSACAVDLDGDDVDELVVVGEWMPIRVFSRKSKWTDVSAKFGLTYTQGWWNKVVAADLDRDGDKDLIVGNLGENYKFQASEDRPFQVFARDFDGNGTNDVFLARYLRDTLMVPVRGRECSSEQVPVIAQKFPTFTSFAESDINQILGNGINEALNLKSYTFSSIVVNNMGGRLVPSKLPIEAQFSTMNGIVVTDVNQDGIQDILIAGNRFDVEVETTAADASPGCFLMGIGNMNYNSVPSHLSGLRIPYNIKDLSLCRSGKDQLLICTENNGPLHIYRIGSD